MIDKKAVEHIFTGMAEGSMAEIMARARASVNSSFSLRIRAIALPIWATSNEWVSLVR